MGFFGDLSEMIGEGVNNTGALEKKNQCDEEYDRLNKRFNRLKPLLSKRSKDEPLIQNMMREGKELIECWEKRDYDSCLSMVERFSSYLDELEGKPRYSVKSGHTEILSDNIVGRILGESKKKGLLEDIQSGNAPLKTREIPLASISSSDYSSLPKHIIQDLMHANEVKLSKITVPKSDPLVVQKNIELQKEVCRSHGMTYGAPYSFGGSLIGTEGFTLPKK